MKAFHSNQSHIYSMEKPFPCQPQKQDHSNSIGIPEIISSLLTPLLAWSRSLEAPASSLHGGQEHRSFKFFNLIPKIVSSLVLPLSRLSCRKPLHRDPLKVRSMEALEVRSTEALKVCCVYIGLCDSSYYPYLVYCVHGYAACMVMLRAWLCNNCCEWRCWRDVVRHTVINEPGGVTQLWYSGPVYIWSGLFFSGYVLYSGLHLIRPPSGPVRVSWLEGWPLWDFTSKSSLWMTREIINKTSDNTKKVKGIVKNDNSLEIPL